MHRVKNNNNNNNNIIVNFAVPANHRIKIKESEKKDKYLNQRTKKKIF